MNVLSGSPVTVCVYKITVSSPVQNAVPGTQTRGNETRGQGRHVCSHTPGTPGAFTGVIPAVLV